MLDLISIAKIPISAVTSAIYFLYNRLQQDTSVILKYGNKPDAIINLTDQLQVIFEMWHFHVCLVNLVPQKMRIVIGRPLSHIAKPINQLTSSLQGVLWLTMNCQGLWLDKNTRNDRVTWTETLPWKKPGKPHLYRFIWCDSCETSYARGDQFWWTVRIGRVPGK